MNERTYIKEINRCTGECCSAFNVGGKTHEEIHEVRKRAEDNYGGKENLSVEDAKYLKDIRQIDDMLIEIGKFELHPFHPEISIAAGMTGREPSMFFTCKHFDKEKRNCMDYENRPAMCSSYPMYRPDGKCEYEGCTFKYEEYELNENFLTKEQAELPDVKEKIQ